MLMRHAPVYVRYCGIVDYHKNVDVLKKYYLLLFPSVYIAEGFPGTLTDAFFSELRLLPLTGTIMEELLGTWKNRIPL